MLRCRLSLSPEDERSATELKVHRLSGNRARELSEL